MVLFSISLFLLFLSLRSHFYTVESSVCHRAFRFWLWWRERKKANICGRANSSQIEFSNKFHHFKTENLTIGDIKTAIVCGLNKAYFFCVKLTLSLSQMVVKYMQDMDILSIRIMLQTANKMECVLCVCVSVNIEVFIYNLTNSLVL